MKNIYYSLEQICSKHLFSFFFQMTLTDLKSRLTLSQVLGHYGLRPDKNEHAQLPLPAKSLMLPFWARSGLASLHSLAVRPNTALLSRSASSA